MDKIYTVTTIEKLDQTNDLYTDTGYTRTIGWYTKEDRAKSIVIRNGCDMNETIYDYAVVEELGEGLYPNASQRWLFKFNRSTRMYEEIEEIEELRGFVSIG